MKLFDSRGNQIVNIIENKIVGKIDSRKYSIQNGDHSIDIFDVENDNLIFHIRYLNRKAIEILGNFYYPSLKKPVIITRDVVLFPNGSKYENGCLSNMGEYGLAIN